MINFILATSGLTWILCRSTLFKKTRERISFIYDEIQTAKKFNKRTWVIKEKFYWWLDSLFSCVGCMGFWAGMVNSVIISHKIELESIIYGFIGTISSLLIVSLLGFLDRK